MTASTWIERAKDHARVHRSTDQQPTRAWIGVDFSGEDGARPARRLLPLLVLALIVALGVSALRIDLIRTRYAMAAIQAEEEALIEEQRNLIIKRRQLRDPVELAIQARERGFRPLSTVLSVPDPVVGASGGPRPIADVASRPISSANRESGNSWE